MDYWPFTNLDAPPSYPNTRQFASTSTRRVLWDSEVWRRCLPLELKSWAFFCLVLLQKFRRTQVLSSDSSPKVSHQILVFSSFHDPPEFPQSACVCQISDFIDSKKVSCSTKSASHWFSFILLLNRPSAVPKSWNQVSWHCTTFSARKRRWGNASLIPPTTDPHGSVHRISSKLLTNKILGPLWEKPLTALTNQCRFHCGEDTLHDTPGYWVSPPGRTIASHDGIDDHTAFIPSNLTLAPNLQ